MRRRNKTALLCTSVFQCGAVVGALYTVHTPAAHAQSLFTSASDWTVYNSAISTTAGTNNGWTGGSGITTAALLDTSAADLDGNPVNGLGNINTATAVSSAGQPGGLGGLQVTNPAGGGFNSASSPEESAVGTPHTPNSNFFTALANPVQQYIAADFTLNSATGLAASTYIQPEFLINDSKDGFDQLGTINVPNRTPSSMTAFTVDGTAANGEVVYDGINSAGNPQFTLYEIDPYSGTSPTLTLKAGDTYTYYQFGFILNSNYAGVWDLDNIRLTPNITVPEPASLGLLGMGIPALLLRRRTKV
jgi:hypothetical protein